MLFTIFTPAYNRGYIIENLYQSLLKQSFRDFEWLIVDDGSTDNTEALIQSFIAENKLNIRYFKQKNQGKHIAINSGLKEARGFYFFTVDSDDFLPNDSLEILQQESNNIKKGNNAGLIGLKSYTNHQIIKRSFDGQQMECSSLDFTYKYGYNEEMAVCIKTSIAQQFPFPVIEGEKFCPESLVLNRISQNYTFYYFGRSIYTGDYLEDGLSAKYWENFKKSVNYALIYWSELASSNIPKEIRIKALKNYFAFSHNIPNRIFRILKDISPSNIILYYLNK
ncbi:glycosyltransferase family 2 protein [Chryseobacterium sp.]|uniref:glycosyltransferase family A protein n=1 Tax=Chryseobacterium sp. TaxID=1871047 RepID=UPI00289BC7A5|nr:glycosyltransferase family 2 protein [Chryseobacterium sp.]